jgi:hypothetical protein
MWENIKTFFKKTETFIKKSYDKNKNSKLSTSNIRNIPIIKQLKKKSSPKINISQNFLK